MIKLWTSIPCSVGYRLGYRLYQTRHPFFRTRPGRRQPLGGRAVPRHGGGRHSLMPRRGAIGRQAPQREDDHHHAEGGKEDAARAQRDHRLHRSGVTPATETRIAHSPCLDFSQTPMPFSYFLQIRPFSRTPLVLSQSSRALDTYSSRNHPCIPYGDSFQECRSYEIRVGLQNRYP